MSSLRTVRPLRIAVAALLTVSGAALATPAFAATPSAAPAFGPAQHGSHAGLHYGHGSRRYDGGVWGGYVATGSNFNSVSGSWTMPQVTCNTSNDLFAPWVGIDGYGSQTVEQTGVQVDCSSGSPVLSGWYEMYPAPPQYFSDPVNSKATTSPAA